MTEEKFEIESKDAEFLKVSTNIHGGLRFKTSKESEAVKMYAEQISTDRRAYGPADVKKMSGFKVITVKDKTRCLKPLQPKNSVDSSTALSTD
ncbi:hypothetical protein [Gimesia sp.]|uniref:hypothetical protein n=1 Tax=Gimesia sp. TaxID=2024833 RepID=UPI000C4EFEFA|nr:hypothetical protein [Gimesia sp.]MAX35703.1 hypothetical protein [Gimesia sp.]HBL47655.1 hypothetical protein [Planctomycetaceae bacterium]